MLKIRPFTFNPFQENMYLIWNEALETLIIDPGCYDPEEKEELFAFIKDNDLKPKRCLLTHAHIDHVMGLSFIEEAYGLRPELHHSEYDLLRSAPVYGQNWGIMCEAPPLPTGELKAGEQIKLGEDIIDIIHTPGHSPGSLCFIMHAQKDIIGGDVLFHQSIGRTDLPGGNHETLIKSIREKLFTLDDDYTVYPGHGPSTSIGYEKVHNPFLK
jgi:hydroxyacylglutathione hydrolase